MRFEIPDQVSTLVNSKGGGIPATYLSSIQSSFEVKGVYQELQKCSPSCKLLYVTPERLASGRTIHSIFEQLVRKVMKLE